MKLPDYVTSLNLLAGIAAIFSALHGYPVLASSLILAGVVFDAFDGFIARKMKIESDFGAELDSLADLLTFGIAPMILIMTKFDGAAAVLAGLLPFCGALRLARHNVNHKQTKGYLIGLPITTNGFVIAILVFLDLNATVFAVASVLLALGMLSTIRVNKLLK